MQLFRPIPAHPPGRVVQSYLQPHAQPQVQPYPLITTVTKPRVIIQRHAVGGSPRVYQNLNPAAAIPVEKDQVFKLNSFYDHHYRLNRGSERGQYVPNSRYVFVTLTSGETLLHPRYRHPALAQGRPVLYAGEASFNNGKLDWWSNASGNYRPDPDHAVQAGLPMDAFYKWEDIQRGVHTRPGRGKR